MLLWELLGAMTGAGFASGREIAAFFSRHGKCGYAGAVVSVMVLVFLANTNIQRKCKPQWLQYVWNSLSHVLLITTGGAMLAAAGETVQLILPVKGAYWVGMALTLVLSVHLATPDGCSLAWISCGLAGMYILVMIAGFRLPHEQSLSIQQGDLPMSLLHGACYGGFNAALLIPMTSSYDSTQRRRGLFGMGAMMIGLLWAGNAVLLRHPSLMNSPLPFVKMMNMYGIWGYVVSAACLYLAVMSTLIACIRSLEHKRTAIVGLVFVALLGFDRVVGRGYSLLGAACMVTVFIAKFSNCAAKAFISADDML